MQKQRRQLLLGLPLVLIWSAARGQGHPLDAVPVYLIPLHDFPEDLAEALAKSLQQNLNFRVKASLRLPQLQIATLPGTNQLMAEEVLLLGSKASSRLPEVAPSTYRIFLTFKDINSRSANFRFQFSAHNTALKASVISVARLLDYINERPVLSQRSAVRLLKMTKRAIGEMYLGWTRSPNPNDLMYSPLMGLDDLDRIGLDHAENPKENSPTPAVPQSSANSV